jgi:hypothetical protein
MTLDGHDVLKLAGKRRCEYRLPEAVGAGDLAVEFGFEVVDGGGAGFDLGNNLVLFGEGWDRNRKLLHYCAVDLGHIARDASRISLEVVSSRKAIEVDDQKFPCSWLADPNSHHQVGVNIFIFWPFVDGCRAE